MNRNAYPIFYVTYKIQGNKMENKQVHSDDVYEDGEEIIPLQSNDMAKQQIIQKQSEMAKKKKIVKAKIKPTTEGNDIPHKHAEEATSSHIVESTPAFVEPANKSARGVYLKYEIHLPSIMYVQYIMSQFSTDYPIEMSRFMNHIRFRTLSTSESKCVMSFQSHLTHDQLVAILSKNEHAGVRASTTTLTASKSKSKPDA